jgi:hypothetical protein
LGVAEQITGQEHRRRLSLSWGGFGGKRSNGNHFAATVDLVPACDAQPELSKHPPTAYQGSVFFPNNFTPVSSIQHISPTGHDGGNQSLLEQPLHNGDVARNFGPSIRTHET